MILYSLDDPEVDVDPGVHQIITFYEVAVGSDRRYAITKNNIHPFINVGLNKTWTFTNLDLIPRTAVYYITVRAHSASSANVEVTSNGISVGHGGSVIAKGTIDMPE